MERLSPKEKLDLLADLTRVVPDYGSRPWQIVKDLFGFRNDIAHGKPVNLANDTLEDVDAFLDEKLGESIRTEWELFCTEENAIKAKEDVEKIAEALYKASDVAKKQKAIGPFSFGFQTHTASL